jgi:hypothetical protein
MSSAISSFALAQEDRHPHLELLGKCADALAILLYGLDVRIRARGGVADFGGTFGDGTGKSQSFVGVARHRRCRAILLFHRNCNGRKQRLNNLDHVGNPLHRLKASRGIVLKRIDLLRNLCRGFLRLQREILHFGGDDRETATGRAGARGLGRGVKREQIGLSRHRRNQVHHMTYFRR